MRSRRRYYSLPRVPKLVKLRAHNLMEDVAHCGIDGVAQAYIVGLGHVIRG